MNDRFISPSRLFLYFFVALVPGLALAQEFRSLPPVDSLTAGELNSYIRSLSSKAANLEQTLLYANQDATAAFEIMESEWQNAKADSTVSKEGLKPITADYKAAKKVAQTAIRNYKRAAKHLDLVQKTADADEKLKRKNLKKLWNDSQKLERIAYPAPPDAVAAEFTEDASEDLGFAEDASSEAGILALPPGQPIAKPQNTTVRTKAYDPEADVNLHPPALPCTMAVEKQDEFTGELYRRTSPVELFRHSPPALKTFLAGQANVRCDASLAAAGANPMLHLNFTIIDPNPRKAFGKVDKDSQLTLLFMDGSTYFLNNLQNSEGVQSIDGKSFAYHIQYALSSDALKKIRNTELDRIRIIWSAGFEDYDVHYVQLLMQQAKCLFD